MCVCSLHLPSLARGAGSLTFEVFFLSPPVAILVRVSRTQIEADLPSSLSRASVEGQTFDGERERAREWVEKTPCKEDVYFYCDLPAVSVFLVCLFMAAVASFGVCVRSCGGSTANHCCLSSWIKSASRGAAWPRCRGRSETRLNRLISGIV